MKVCVALVAGLLAAGGVGLPVMAQVGAQPPTRYLSLLTSVGGLDQYPSYGVEAGWLAEGLDGSLYTTSKHGGTNRCGSIIKFTLDGQFKVVGDFDGSNGSLPLGGLTRGKDGSLYGTTYGGGTNKVGAIFKVSPTGGVPTVLWHFENRKLNGTNYTQQQKWDAAGGYPAAAPALGKDGQLYGVAGYAHNQQYGILYRIGSGGGYQALYFFDGVGNGTYPVLLIAGSDGNLYGTTYEGLTPSTKWGTVFKATPAGGVTTLHEFSDARLPVVASVLIYGSDGNLYGTTQKGLVGAGGGRGILYKLPLDGKGKFQVLHQFVGGTDGQSPTGLVEGDDGFLYGVAVGGTGMGSVFYRIAKDGQGFKVLSRFVGATTGAAPQGNLMRHSNSNFYGTANTGGAFNRGTMYVANPCPLWPRPGQPEFTGGALAYSDDLVDVRTNVQSRQAGVNTTNLQDGITIQVKCGDAPQVIQFIHREYIFTNGTRQAALYPTAAPGGGTNWWPLTTDPKAPRWRVDAPKLALPAPQLPSPCYTNTKAARYDCDSLTTFDQPTLSFGTNTQYQLLRATAKVFVTCGGKVVRELQWSRELKFGGSPTYTVHRSGLLVPDPFQKISDGEGFAKWP